MIHMTLAPKFFTGRIQTTKAIAERMNREKQFGDFISDCLKRHITCDWGDVDGLDVRMNDDAVKSGEGEIHSIYAYPESDETIWVMTNGDRSATTVLYPYEY